MSKRPNRKSGPTTKPKPKSKFPKPNKVENPKKFESKFVSDLIKNFEKLYETKEDYDLIIFAGEDAQKILYRSNLMTSDEESNDISDQQLSALYEKAT